MRTTKANSPTIMFVLILTIALAMALFATVPGVQAQEGTPPPTQIPEIVGGAPATPGEWPWQVALVDGAATGPNYWDDQFCGGSLVHPQWVVTAGHCVTDNSGNVEAPTSIDIVAGIYNLSSPAGGYQQRDVIQIIRHPNYNDSTLNNDIAMLKLASPVTIGGSGETSTALVQLAPASLGTLAGTNSWVTGWGTTQSTPAYPNELYEVQLPILSNSTCNDSNHWGGRITSNMLCAGYDVGGYSACFGDSGGPLVVQSSGQWYLAGIISFGDDPCAMSYSPSVFARVSQYGGWINTNIGPSTLVSPSAAIGSNYNPTYTWNAVATMTYYYLYVNGPSGNVIKQWYSAAEAGCTDGTGTCSVTPTTPLGGGAHTWWVQTWNAAGYGAWSSGMNFSTTIPTTPGIATLSSPNGSIVDFTPTFSWNEVLARSDEESAATYYYLYVNGPSGNVIKQWYQAAAICSSGTCSVTPGTALGGGAYTWWVQTWNAAGTGPWSVGMNFSLPIPTAPGAATQTSPSGSIGTNTPAYTWNEVLAKNGEESAATYYYLYVNGPSGNVIKQWYSAASICSGGTCSVIPSVALAPGSHTWWVQTWNSAGYGLWSAGMFFSTPIPWPGQPTQISPSGTVNDLTPTYTWNEVISKTEGAATWYYLYVSGPSGTVVKDWYEASALCSGGTCSATPTKALVPGGTYTWWVQGWNPSGYGVWSSGLSLNLASIGGFDSQFNGSSTGWTPYYGTWSLSGNQWYYANGDNDYWVTTGYTGGNYSNFDVQARVYTSSPEFPYLLVRGTPTPLSAYQDWNSAYYFGFDTNGYYQVGKMVNNSWTDLQPWTYTPYLNHGAWNVLRVIAAGNSLYYYINGNLVWSGTDSSLASGQIGFELGSLPSYSLWVDWTTLNSYNRVEDMSVVTDVVSAEQQALNEAALSGISDKAPGRERK